MGQYGDESGKQASREEDNRLEDESEGQGGNGKNNVKKLLTDDGKLVVEGWW